MAVKKKKIERLVEDEVQAAPETEIDNDVAEDVASDNADTIKSKVGLMSNVIDAMGNMSKQDFTQWFDQAMALIGHEADQIPDGTADRNRASVAMKGAIKEEISEIFGSEKLSEEFKFRAETLFEAAVASAVALRTEELQEQYENTIAEKVEEVVTDLTEKLDQYVTYVAEQWIVENQVAIDKTLNAEIVEGFMVGMKELFDNHYITVPETKVDVVEQLVTELEDTTAKLNEQIKANIEAMSILESIAKEEIVEEIGSDLTAIQKGKLLQLAEDLDFSDEQVFRSKVKILKEKATGTKAPVSTNIITEELEEPALQEAYIDPVVSKYVKAISRTAVK